MAKKILVVDDEEDFVDMIKIRLKANGYDVVTANDGREGLKVWEEEQPDLILLDIMMTDLDGYSFVQESKSMPELNPVPIIVLTAKPDFKEIFEMEGVRDYALKPCDDTELLRKIKAVIGGQ
jgi:DNA-binding response OmpR family regulator